MTSIATTAHAPLPAPSKASPRRPLRVVQDGPTPRSKCSIHLSVHKDGTEVWRVYFRVNGKQGTRPFVTEAAALRFKRLADETTIAEVLALVDGQAKVSAETVGAYVAAHIDALGKTVQEGTKARYRRYLTNDIGPAFGSLPLTMLTRERVAAWLATMAAAGSSTHTISNKHAVLSAALTRALNEGIIERHPSRGMRMPVPVAMSEEDLEADDEMIFLTRDEVAALFDQLDPYFRPLARLLVTTGLRFGEATALTVADIDPERRTVHVRRAWKDTNNNGRLLSVPKTMRSKRVVSIPPNTLTELEPLLEGRDPAEFLFRNKLGGPLRHSNFYRSYWAKAVHDFAGDTFTLVPGINGRGNLGLVREWTSGPGRHPRIHDLRHTYVSMCIAAGADFAMIQRNVGHKSITTTIDRYGHVARASFDKLAAATDIDLPAMA